MGGNEGVGKNNGRAESQVTANLTELAGWLVGFFCSIIYLLRGGEVCEVMLWRMESYLSDNSKGRRGGFEVVTGDFVLLQMRSFININGIYTVNNNTGPDIYNAP